MAPERSCWPLPRAPVPFWTQGSSSVGCAWASSALKRAQVLALQGGCRVGLTQLETSVFHLTCGLLRKSIHFLFSLAPLSDHGACGSASTCVYRTCVTEGVWRSWFIQIVDRFRTGCSAKQQPVILCSSGGRIHLQLRSPLLPSDVVGAREHEHAVA